MIVHDNTPSILVSDQGREKVQERARNFIIKHMPLAARQAAQGLLALGTDARDVRGVYRKLGFAEHNLRVVITDRAFFDSFKKEEAGSDFLIASITGRAPPTLMDMLVTEINRPLSLVSLGGGDKYHDFHLNWFIRLVCNRKLASECVVVTSFRSDGPGRKLQDGKPTTFGLDGSCLSTIFKIMGSGLSLAGLANKIAGIEGAGLSMKQGMELEAVFMAQEQALGQLIGKRANEIIEPDVRDEFEHLGRETNDLTPEMAKFSYGLLCAQLMQMGLGYQLVDGARYGHVDLDGHEVVTDLMFFRRFVAEPDETRFDWLAVQDKQLVLAPALQTMGAVQFFEQVVASHRHWKEWYGLAPIDVPARVFLNGKKAPSIETGTTVSLGRQRAQVRLRDFIKKHLHRYKDGRVLCMLPPHSRDIEVVYRKLGFQDQNIIGITDDPLTQSAAMERYPNLKGIYGFIPRTDIEFDFEGTIDVVSIDCLVPYRHELLAPFAGLLTANRLSDTVVLVVSCLKTGDTKESPCIPVHEAVSADLDCDKIGRLPMFSGCTYNEDFLSTRDLANRALEESAVKQEHLASYRKSGAFFHGVIACREELRRSIVERVKRQRHSLQSLRDQANSLTEARGVKGVEFIVAGVGTMTDERIEETARRAAYSAHALFISRYGYDWHIQAVERYTYEDGGNTIGVDFMLLGRVPEDVRSRMLDWIVVDGDDRRMHVAPEILAMEPAELMTIIGDQRRLHRRHAGDVDIAGLPEPEYLGSGQVAIGSDVLKARVAKLVAKGRTDDEIMARYPVSVDFLRVCRDEFVAEQERARRKQPVVVQPVMSLVPVEAPVEPVVVNEPPPEDPEARELEALAAEIRAEEERDREEREVLARKAREETLAWKTMTPEERAAVQRKAMELVQVEPVTAPPESKPVEPELVEPELVEPETFKPEPEPELVESELVEPIAPPTTIPIPTSGEHVSPSEIAMPTSIERNESHRNDPILVDLRMDMLRETLGGLSDASPLFAKNRFLVGADREWARAVARVLCARGIISDHNRHYRKIDDVPAYGDRELCELAMLDVQATLAAPVETLAVEITDVIVSRREVEDVLAVLKSRAPVENVKPVGDGPVQPSSPEQEGPASLEEIMVISRELLYVVREVIPSVLQAVREMQSEIVGMRRKVDDLHRELASPPSPAKVEK